MIKYRAIHNIKQITSYAKVSEEAKAKSKGAQSVDFLAENFEKDALE